MIVHRSVHITPFLDFSNTIYMYKVSAGGVCVRDMMSHHIAILLRAQVNALV